MQALTAVGMPHLRDRPPYRLSGGEKRAVAIATVLSMAPDILVMDEPTTDLDPLGPAAAHRAAQDFPHTKIIATHDLDLVLDLCERTIVLHEGRSWPTAPRQRSSRRRAAGGLPPGEAAVHAGLPGLRTEVKSSRERPVTNRSWDFSCWPAMSNEHRVCSADQVTDDHPGRKSIVRLIQAWWTAGKW